MIVIVWVVHPSAHSDACLGKGIFSAACCRLLVDSVAMSNY